MKCGHSNNVLLGYRLQFVYLFILISTPPTPKGFWAAYKKAEEGGSLLLSWVLGLAA